MNFSERLKAIIKTSGLKREDFAKRVGKSRSQLFNYLGGAQMPTADFFQEIKREFPWVNIEWLITGAGEMEAGQGPRPQIVTGNGNIQAGGSVRAGDGARIGGVHAGRDVLTVQEKGATWQSTDPDLIEVLDLLRDYGTPKMLAELRNKLLQIKKAMEGG